MMCADCHSRSSPRKMKATSTALFTHTVSPRSQHRGTHCESGLRATYAEREIPAGQTSPVDVFAVSPAAKPKPFRRLRWRISRNFQRRSRLAKKLTSLRHKGPKAKSARLRRHLDECRLPYAVATITPRGCLWSARARLATFSLAGP